MPEPHPQPQDTAFRVMVKTFPLDLQFRIERLLRELGIQNDDDDLLRLMTVLGLFATYYQKIPERIIEAGERSDKRLMEGLTAIDRRVEQLQANAQLLQQATDKLSTIGNDIVTNFPTEKIALTVASKVDDKLVELRLTQFERTIEGTKRGIEQATATAVKSAEKISASAVVMDDCAERLQQVSLPWMSIKTNAIFTAIGLVLGAVLVLIFR